MRKVKIIATLWLDAKDEVSTQSILEQWEDEACVTLTDEFGISRSQVRAIELESVVGAGGEMLLSDHQWA